MKVPWIRDERLCPLQDAIVGHVGDAWEGVPLRAVCTLPAGRAAKGCLRPPYWSAWRATVGSLRQADYNARQGVPLWAVGSHWTRRATVGSLRLRRTKAWRATAGSQRQPVVRHVEGERSDRDVTLSSWQGCCARDRSAERTGIWSHGVPLRAVSTGLRDIMPCVFFFIVGWRRKGVR